MTDLERNLALYLRTHGWQANREPGPMGRLWTHEDTGMSVAVPVRVLPGTFDWESITGRLAEVENADSTQIEQQLVLVSTDVANLRAANDVVITDTIPYDAALVLIQGGWQMFKASAATSRKPRASINGGYNSTARGIISTARMAHTKRGSFVIPLLLPVSEPPKIDGTFEGVASAEPAERRVMRTFAEALSEIDHVVLQPDREPNSSTLLDLVYAGVSAEFTSALHRILSQEPVDEFRVDFQWAPIAGKPPDQPSSVSIPASAARLVSIVADKLRKTPQARDIEILTGPIISASRLSEGGGTVTIDTVRNSRDAHVQVTIADDAQFDEALDWMKRRTTVVVEGRITRRGNNLVSDRTNGVFPRSSGQLFS